MVLHVCHSSEKIKMSMACSFRRISDLVDKNVVLNSSSTFWNLWMIHYLSVCTLHTRARARANDPVKWSETYTQPTPNKRPMTAWTWCKSSFYYNEPVSESLWTSSFLLKWFSFFCFVLFYCCDHCTNACFILNYSTFDWLFYKQREKTSKHALHLR